MNAFILVQFFFSFPCQFSFNCLPTHFQFPANLLPNRCQKSDTDKDRMLDMCLSAQSGVSPARSLRALCRQLRASPRDPVMLAPTPWAGWTALRERTGRFNPRLGRRQRGRPAAG